MFCHYYRIICLDCLSNQVSKGAKFKSPETWAIWKQFRYLSKTVTFLNNEFIGKSAVSRPRGPAAGVPSPASTKTCRLRTRLQPVHVQVELHRVQHDAVLPGLLALMQPARETQKEERKEVEVDG